MFRVLGPRGARSVQGIGLMMAYAFGSSVLPASASC